MTLVAGQTLSFYEVLGPLGAGGMGEVWRARDTRLEREVAIKVLPDELADDEERLRRFEREAKTLASLSHPNVAHVYGIDQVGETCFIAMELVSGEDLGQRLKRGALPVAEAIGVCRQIAEGLEAAHEAGVVHRDLKPANVRITTEGLVKVLDFGLAKPMRPALRASSETGVETVTAEPDSFLVTEEGMVLGTPTYMSPEQARGRPVDRRTDVWAFGCVLYECLTGRRAFDGETVSDVLAAVLDREPDLTRLPEGTPAHVRALIRRCLVKDPHERLRDVGEARLALAGKADPETAAPPAPARPRSAWRVVAAFAAGALLVALGAWTLRAPVEADHRRPSRFVLTGMGLSIDAFQGIALSPDGRKLVFRGRTPGGKEQLLLRSLDSLEVRPLEGTDLGWLPFFAPDGDRLGFYSLGEIKTLSLSTGLTRKMGWVDARFSGGTFLPDGSIVYTAADEDRLHRIPPDGGPEEALAIEEGPKAEVVTSPHALPGGEAVLCAFRMGPTYNVGVYEIAERRLTELAVNGFTPIWSPSGHVVYQLGNDGPLMVLPFDPKRLAGTGEAFPVLSDVGQRVSFQVGMFAVARNGTLAYIPRNPRLDGGAFVWVDREGESTLVAEFDRIVDTPRLSSDGRFIAFRTPAPECDVWVHDVERGTTTRVTQEGDNHGVVWSPDDRRVLFARGTEQDWAIFSCGRDGVGGLEQLTEFGIKRAFASSISPDGRHLLVGSMGESTAGNIVLASLEDGTVRTLLDTRHAESGGVFSPDGRHVAYVSNESEREQIYVQPFPGLETRIQVSTDGGTEPAWSRDGSKLYFRSGRKMMEADVTASPAFGVGRPRVVFEGDFAARGASALPDYDVHPDGERFLMIRERTLEGGADLNLILDWFTELEDLAPDED